MPSGLNAATLLGLGVAKTSSCASSVNDEIMYSAAAYTPQTHDADPHPRASSS
jgi:hypothetical protein